MHDHDVTPAAASPEYSSGNVSPSPAARSPTEVTFLRQPTRPLAKAGRLLESASIQRWYGRSFQGDPERPYHRQMFKEGQEASGHPLGSPQAFGYPQKQVSGTPPSPHARHTLNIGPEAPGGVSRWAPPPGAGFAVPNHRQAGRTAGPIPGGPGVRTKWTGALRPSPQSPFPHPQGSPPIGTRPLSPIPARACPAHRVSAPCSPPDQPLQRPQPHASESK